MTPQPQLHVRSMYMYYARFSVSNRLSLLTAAHKPVQEHGACPIHRASQAVAALSGGARLLEGGA